MPHHAPSLPGQVKFGSNINGRAKRTRVGDASRVLLPPFNQCLPGLRRITKNASVDASQSLHVFMDLFLVPCPILVTEVFRPTVLSESLGDDVEICFLFQAGKSQFQYVQRASINPIDLQTGRSTSSCEYRALA